MGRIVVAGGTGAVGRPAVRALVAAGHEVVGLARSPRARATLDALGAGAVDADPYDPAGLRRAFAGADVVVNLLTRIPPLSRAGLPGAWRANDRLRREASRTVAGAARNAGATRLVQESIVLLYADGGDAWLDEGAPLDPAGPPAGAVAAEENARAFGDAVVLRFALFYGPGSGQTAEQVAQARRGLSVQAAPATARVSNVWLEDAGRAVLAAVSAPVGTYNVVEDDPPTRAGADAALASAVGRERLRAPAAALARVLPPLRPLARSLRVSNARLREATGWAPEVHQLHGGWDRAVADATART